VSAPKTTMPPASMTAANAATDGCAVIAGLGGLA
jgi:hypothetical protein